MPLEEEEIRRRRHVREEDRRLFSGPLYHPSYIPYIPYLKVLCMVPYIDTILLKKMKEQHLYKKSAGP
jgi:hypothetical protein